LQWKIKEHTCTEWGEQEGFGILKALELFFDYMGKLIPRSKEYTLMLPKFSLCNILGIATLIIASSFWTQISKLGQEKWIKFHNINVKFGIS
jgi:hypothetical protein